MKEYGELHEAFRLVSAIKEIVQCKSIYALKGLKKVIDDQLKELDGIEQNTDFTEQTGAKTGQNHSKTEQKKKKKNSYGQALFPEDQILAQYGTTTIYRPILDKILLKIEDTFTNKDVINSIEKVYKKDLKKEITQGSCKAYSSQYLKYMVISNLVKKEEKKRYNALFKKCTAVQKEDSDILSDYDENKEKAIRERMQFEREVCQ